jgi:type IV secretion system protein VirD4
MIPRLVHLTAGSPVLVLAMLVLFLLALLFAKWAFVPTSHLPRHRVRHHRIRLALRLHPGRGHATVFELWLRWGRLAAFLHSGQTRGGTLTFWQRATANTWAYSVMIGRGHYRHGLRTGLDEHVLVIAAPRTGKTGAVSGFVLHHPGPAVNTTTKNDVFELTSGVRAQHGPVYVFNPQQIGGVASSFAWNPVRGCQVPATAMRRADAFGESVSQKGVEDASFWSAKASQYLAALFCAADLMSADLRQVALWASGDASDAVAVLFGHGYDQWATALAELAGDAQKTAQTVRMTMSKALTFLADPELAACVLPVSGDGLDIEEFLHSRGTLYMIDAARTDQAPCAAVFAALVGEIHYTAGLIGSQSPAGRLDPPLLLALDEVTQICPVPVDSWLADSAGKGIQIITVAHGVAQLRKRWGADGAQAILDTSPVKMFLPGITDTATLKMASELCGQVALREHGADEHRRHDVMSADMISRLPKQRALVLRTGLAPVVAHLTMAWEDRTYKRARRRGRAAALVLPAAARAALDTPAGAQERPPARPAWPAAPGLPRPVIPPESPADPAPAPRPPYPGITPVQLAGEQARRQGEQSPDPQPVPDDIAGQFPWTAR